MVAICKYIIDIQNCFIYSAREDQVSDKDSAQWWTPVRPYSKESRK